MTTSSPFVYFTADEIDIFSVFAENKDDLCSTILSLSMAVSFLALQSGVGAKVIPWNLLLGKALRMDVSKEGNYVDFPHPRALVMFDRG